MTSAMYFWVIVVVAIIAAIAFGPLPVIALAIIAVGILGLYLGAFYLYTFGVPGWLVVAFALFLVALAIGVIGQQYSLWRENVKADLDAHYVRQRDGDETPNRAKIAAKKFLDGIE